MAVWFMRWPQCADTIQSADGIAITIAPLLGEELTLFRAETAPPMLEAWERQ